jgi:hypothetical protein
VAFIGNTRLFEDIFREKKVFYKKSGAFSQIKRLFEDVMEEFDAF